MAHHKRKHHSKSKRNRQYGMISHDRRGHAMGEHDMGGHHGRNVSGDYFSREHGREDARGFRPREEYGESFEERMDLNKKMRIMMTNNGNMGPIREDFNRPCGLPYGAIQRDLGNGDYYSMNGYRVGDLYEQVDKSMRQDADAIKSITRPTNW